MCTDSARLDTVPSKSSEDDLLAVVGIMVVIKSQEQAPEMS